MPWHISRPRLTAPASSAFSSGLRMEHLQWWCLRAGASSAGLLPGSLKRNGALQQQADGQRPDPAAL